MIGGDSSEELSGRAGFTLAELIVVIFVLGILAWIGIPQYNKSVESSRADEAVSLVQMIATTNRMYALDNNNVFTSGQLTDSCLSAPCTAPGNDPCNLIACNYLAKQTFSNKSYDLFAVDGSLLAGCTLTGAGGTNYAACGKRKSGAASPYADWGYTVDKNGLVQAWPVSGGPPPPPS